MVVRLLSARSAEPPHSSGSTGARAVRMVPEALRVAMPLASAGNEGSASAHPSGSWRTASRSNSARRSGVGGAPRGERLLPLGVQALAALRDLARVGERLVLDREVDPGIEAEDFLGRRHLVGAERGAVRGTGVLLVRGRPADDRAERDEGRRLGVLPGRQQRLVERLDVLVVPVRGTPAQALDVPAVGLVAGGDVLGLGDVRVVFDGDVVVVVDHDEVAEPLVPGQRGHLVADAFLDVAVGDEGVDVVVERAAARLGVRVVQSALAARGHGHADRVADALAERPGGGLHARRQAVLGVPGGDAAPGPVGLQVIQGHPVPGQVQLDVQGQARMPARQHETVPARPVRIRRVVPEQSLEEKVGHRGQAHRRARVPVAYFLDRIHRQDPDEIDGALVGCRPVKLGLIAHGRSLSVQRQVLGGTT